MLDISFAEEYRLAEIRMKNAERAFDGWGEKYGATLSDVFSEQRPDDVVYGAMRSAIIRSTYSIVYEYAMAEQEFERLSELWKENQGESKGADQLLEENT